MIEKVLHSVVNNHSWDLLASWAVEKVVDAIRIATKINVRFISLRFTIP